MGSLTSSASSAPSASSAVPNRVERERLLVRLRQRHRLSLVVLEAPAGFGRSVLLEQALAEGPEQAGDHDLFYRCGPDDSDLGHLVRGLLTAGEMSEGSRRLAAGTAASTAPFADVTGVDHAAGLIAAAIEDFDPDGHTALVVDNVERTRGAPDALWPALVERLSERTHLVLSGRRLPSVGLSRQVASGRGELIGTAALAFRPDEVDRLGHLGSGLAHDAELASWPALASLILRGHPELVTPFLTESVLSDLDPTLVRTLAAVTAVGGCAPGALSAVAETMATCYEARGWADDAVGSSSKTPGSDAIIAERNEIIAGLARVPLVETGHGCWPHPIWAEATRSVLSPPERTLAVTAAAVALVRAGAVHEAGRLALRTGDGGALRLVVRKALAAMPPNASTHDLRAWSASGLLSREAPEHSFLAGVLDLQTGGSNTNAAAHLESARARFEADDDHEGEAWVLLHLGSIAHTEGDQHQLRQLGRRARDLAERGDPVARGLVSLGRAVAAQAAEDHDGAIQSLASMPPGYLGGELGGQVLLLRGSSLLLAGRSDAAIAALDAATGEGAPASRAVAHNLLAVARWYAEDPLGALGDAGTAEALGRGAGSPGFVRLVRASRACMLAALGRRGRALDDLALLPDGTGSPSEDEAAMLTRLARVFLAAEDGDLDGARNVLASTAGTPRTVRSSVWKAALVAALFPERSGPHAADGSALSWAQQAGRSAACHLAGGPPAPAGLRPFLPERWCEKGRPPIRIILAGPGRVERDFEPVTHAAWGRGRVRELCLHLALVEDKSRAGVAAGLWPDRGDRSAGQNLRVTLSHLLDVIEPDRASGAGSSRIIDRDGTLRFSRDADLSIDLWDIHRLARSVITTPGHERAALLAHARRLVAIAPGPILGDSVLGEWFDAPRRLLEEQVVRAALVAGRHALDAIDHELAEALGLYALRVEPWSEQAHGLVIEARLDRGDHDGARRALFHARAALEELSVSPGRGLTELGHRSGLA